MLNSMMKAIDGYFLIKPEDLAWKPANPMKIPNADFLERTKSELLGARLWRLPPKSANTLHKHVRAEEFYFVTLPRPGADQTRSECQPDRRSRGLSLRFPARCSRNPASRVWS